MSDTLRIGSRVRLHNVALASYLDTCGRPMDEPALASLGGAGTVQTSTSDDRDHGSGTWEITAAGGQAAGTVVDNTMQVRLRNLCPGLGHLCLMSVVAAADATALDRLYPEGWGNSNRYVQTVADLGGARSPAVGPAAFAFEAVPASGDHTPVPVADGAKVRLRCYLEEKNYYVAASGPLSAFTTLRLTYPSTQTGLVFAEPNAPVRDASTWIVSLAP